ncbi:MAG: ATP-dependent DNA helicase RecG, partial [Acidobacteria bacterium]|nr:ATP-dependent DNA helicase RecG [Acidobacteriota bacterium]
LRLVQGDVGSGKTIVAALALVVAIESGLQGCFMAPTELLAEQHFRSLSALLGSRYRLGLLTGSSRNAALLRRDLARGRIQLVVGTHALIQEGVEFRCLGLAVIDEQHRFGVTQREVLQRKGERPDVLVMTATPIPRSLALTVYGDLALSVIDELPPGRSPIKTRVVGESERAEVYGWLRRALDEGGQAYVVFPLIEESDRIRAKSIEEMGERLRGFLTGYESAIVHGRTPVEERDDLVRRFAAGEIRVLIATTIIEVGIDVPTASIMIIESAERFGLSQLHQLRGRVGRGRLESHCVAIHGPLSEKGERRLEVFASTTDGFRIAEADLEIRGPGDLLGTRQAGLPIFRVANIVLDRDWLERAREDAYELLARPADLGAEELLARVAPRAADRYERFAGG